MLCKNDLAEIFIDSLSSDGNGVGRIDNMVVFVPGTAPGERVKIKLLKVQKTFAYARVEEVLEPSADRIEPDCPVSAACGGCSLRHITYEAECREKRRQVADAFLRLGGISLAVNETVSSGEAEGYRNKAMFPVSMRDGEVQIGFYQQRSHRVINHTDCRLHPKEFHIIAEALRGFIKENGISLYDEHSGRGLVRHLYLRRGEAGGEIMVCLVINGRELPKSEAFIERLLGLSLPISSILINMNTRNSNVVLGDKSVLLWGKPRISDRMCGISLTLSPESFYQVNLRAAESLYKKAAELSALTGGETVLDLYCGAGLIGLSMAGRAKRIIGVEVVPEAVEDAKRNAAENGIKNAQFILADAGEAAKRLALMGERPDVIIVDPPRKGCDMATILAIVKMAPSRIVMVSCNPATAARDCKSLLEHGYEVKEITPFNLFPRTVHVEVVIQMTRF